MVYHPREDSYFLADFVKQHARGRVLDMCAGTGVQAFAALQHPDAKEIVAVDIDGEALTAIRETKYPIRVVEGDLFAGLKDETFDTIVCNPPYLPNEENDADPALYGGPTGCEFIVRFLGEAKDHLADDGHVLLLFSSLSNKERIDAEIKLLGYAYEELGMLAMFFERLYVYRLWRRP